MTIWSLPAVIFRTIFLNLFVWIPLSAAGFLLLFLLGMAAAALAPFLSHNDLQNWIHCYLAPGHHVAFEILAQIVMGLVVLSAYFALLLLIFSSIIPPESTDTGGSKVWRVVLTSALVPMVLFVTWISVIMITTLNTSEGALSTFITWLPWPLVVGLVFIVGFQIFGNIAFNEQYRARRLSEIYGGKLLVAVIGLSLLAAIPYVYQLLVWITGDQNEPRAKSAIGVLSVVSSVATGIYGHLTRNTESSSLTKYVASLGAALFLYSIAIIAYLLAIAVMPHDTPSEMLDAFRNDQPQALILVWIGLAVGFAFTTNINYLGLYRFYRDRLMEAFMPSPDSIKLWEARYSEADRYSIAELWPQKEADASKSREHPYPIFNTNAIMVNDPDPKLFERGGDNFIFSPLYVGSASTGWQRTPGYIGSRNPVTLPTAMAASGAAINSNAAYIGEGVTRESLVSIAMMLMNLRLGWWFARPNTKPRRPNHVNPGFWAGVMGFGYTSKSNFVELSDGGNFDNLGLYELVRRRLKIILIIDGEEDEASAMPALVSVSQRVRDDFGVILHLDRRVDDLMPAPVPGFPLDVPFAKSAYFTARIEYPDKEDGCGLLIYLKARMIGDLDFIVRGYRAKNSNFPNEPTLNQFFEPEQFEAYRTLGFVAMSRLIGDLKLNGGLIGSGSLLAACGLQPPQMPVQPPSTGHPQAGPGAAP
ncbi:hypothetical protein NLM33_26325 [Bradyrhizobium sp. CCGUVB1N3]|uniref:hypothetical protein n=1 Tax=Bradyrhizobium sp. CCGUVB1N3 TaxID=2949629 RepID=UPI0020B2E939|nr:hypothetical protein [Bradyrhizobium sp. CCGUVB1N3]MCP3473836.1 hypothetical protein [Bradyrhizobium sp. CCGUVB1N3]